jgi:SHS2 domain-containing protein
MRAKTGWRELGSGSDAALLLWAEDFQELLTVGARAIVCFSASIRHEDSRIRTGPMASVQSFDHVDLLIDWLNEVNYQLIVRQWVTWAPVLTSLSESSLTCRMDGYAIDLAEEPAVKEIKAVTRHRPYLGRGTDGTCVARITVDL